VSLVGILKWFLPHCTTRSSMSIENQLFFLSGPPLVSLTGPLYFWRSCPGFCRSCPANNLTFLCFLNHLSTGLGSFVAAKSGKLDFRNRICHRRRSSPTREGTKRQWSDFVVTTAFALFITSDAGRNNSSRQPRWTFTILTLKILPFGHWTSLQHHLF
jgi:hypothetical protein